MAKHWYVSQKAVCPFYKHESRQVIYCEGIKEGTVLHIAFANPADSILHKKECCRDDYENCPIAKFLMLYKYNNN